MLVGGEVRLALGVVLVVVRCIVVVVGGALGSFGVDRHVIEEDVVRVEDVDDLVPEEVCFN